MEYKNFDIVIAKKLASINDLSQILYMDRVSSSGTEMTFETYSKVIKSFINKKEFLMQLNDQTLPLQVNDALDTIRKKSDPIKKDFEDLISTLKYYNYELYVVARRDINDSEIELDNNYYWRTYAIENYSDNTVGVSNFYSGYSIIASETSYLYAYDYLQVFSLTSAQLEEFDLDNTRKSYDFLSSNGMLKDFDDTNPMEFLKSRNYTYKMLTNSIGFE